MSPWCTYSFVHHPSMPSGLKLLICLHTQHTQKMPVHSTVGPPNPQILHPWIQSPADKINSEKNARKFQKAKLEFSMLANIYKYLHCIRYYKYSREDLKYMEGSCSLYANTTSFSIMSILGF